MIELETIGLIKRAIIAIAIVVAVLLAMMGLAVLLRDDGAAAQQREPDLYSGIALDPDLLELDRRALDEAYHGHVIKLFGVWLSDGAREAQRITNGLRIARQAYHMAAQQIAKREQQIKERGR